MLHTWHRGLDPLADSLCLSCLLQCRPPMYLADHGKYGGSTAHTQQQQQQRAAVTPAPLPATGWIQPVPQQCLPITNAAGCTAAAQSPRQQPQRSSPCPPATTHRMACCPRPSLTTQLVATVYITRWKINQLPTQRQDTTRPLQHTGAACTCCACRSRQPERCWG
jgi:hypothetical protein